MMIRTHSHGRGFAVALCAVAGLALAACEPRSGDAGDAASAPPPRAETQEGYEAARARLEEIVGARSEEDRARDAWRHPVETLEFFGVMPTSTVVEVLPGGGWYTRIILPYVATDGRYAAASYPYEMYPLILPNPTEETLARLRVWPETFPQRAAEWAPEGTRISAFEFGQTPDDLVGEVDVVLFIRALHNFNRARGAYGDQALADAFAMLKPGGVVGVVQHRAPADATGAAADGSHGYMTEQAVIELLEGAGFVLEARSEVNANPADRPGPEDLVWRLPPTLALGEDNREAYAAIGESDRMTMRFRKPR